ncbi:response regulator transcription factor [Brevundimonas sp.]|uniref:response regulator transcription factor n=1 Tax=Brevundimonas sp. TaxID=1871086 RepID=UPI0035B07C5C
MLTAMGCQATHVSDPEAAAQALLALRPSLLLLDGRLEEAAALSAEASRDGSLVVVLATSADESAQINALNAGADDILARPVTLTVLAARIRALVRRTQLSGRRDDPPEAPPGWSVDVARRLATSRHGIAVPLPFQQAALLQLLIQSRAAVVSPMDILASPGFERMSDESVRVCMYRLRRRLMAVDPVDPIRTVYGRGYAYVGHLVGSENDHDEGGRNAVDRNGDGALSRPQAEALRQVGSPSPKRAGGPAPVLPASFGGVPRGQVAQRLRDGRP